MKYPLVTIAWIALLPTGSFADLATLRTVGPDTGSMTSNLASVASSTGYTRMADAEVTIEVVPGPNDTARATCTADFRMETESGPLVTAADELVAFPITGLHGDAVQIVDFAVKVDGKPPGDLARRYVEFFQGHFDLTDREPQPRFGRPGSSVFSAYLWKQRFVPGHRATVHVTYRVDLKAQELTYGRKFSNRDDPDVVPIEADQIGPPFTKAYFFDYVLRSGATWSGTIGHEQIILQLDPGLINQRLGKSIIVSLLRTVPGGDIDRLAAEKNRDWTWYGRPAPGLEWDGTKLIYTLNNAKPTDDILFEIPAR